MEDALKYVNKIQPLVDSNTNRAKNIYGKWEDYEPIVNMEQMLWAAENMRSVWYRYHRKPMPAAVYVNWQALYLNHKIKDGFFRLYKSTTPKKTNHKTKKTKKH